MCLAHPLVFGTHFRSTLLVFDPNPPQGDAFASLNAINIQRRKRKEGKLEQDYIDKLNAFENFKW